MSANRSDRGVMSNRFGVKSRRRCRQQYALEPLESRVVLSYAFSYNPVTKVALAVGTPATDSLVIEPVSGFLFYSVNGSAFSGSWGGNPVPADPTVSVDIHDLSSGDGSSLQLGTPTGPASQLLAAFDVRIPSNTADTLTIDDSHGTIMASPIHPYSIDLGNTLSISGPGINYTESSGIFNGGNTLDGSPVNGDLYNVNSTFLGEPVTVITSPGRPAPSMSTPAASIPR